MVQKLSVLVIEDEKSICDFIAKTLNASDYKAVTAGSGKEGLAILTSALPDLVLLDLGLPDMYRYNKADQRMVQLAYNSNFRQSAGAGKSSCS